MKSTQYSLHRLKRWCMALVFFFQALLLFGLETQEITAGFEHGSLVILLLRTFHTTEDLPAVDGETHDIARSIRTYREGCR